MEKIKIGVVGIGHLGSIHAKIYRQMDSCSLAAICDTNKARLNELSQTLGIPGFSDYQDLFGKVKAISIATPTKLHYQIAADFLRHKIHTLVEKPFTTTLEEADSLIKIAKTNNLILQVGHIERFNSAFKAALKFIKNPKFIECHRLSSFPNRSLDIGVVLDLMIHDIDIIMGLVPYKIKKLDSVGINVLTQFEDIANTRIIFENGCVANLTASRISDEIMRKIRIFQENTYISLDYKDARAAVYKKNGCKITKKELPIEKEQPLQKELESFVECIKKNQPPIVSGQIAREALAVALKIQSQIFPTKSRDPDSIGTK